MSTAHADAASADPAYPSENNAADLQGLLERVADGDEAAFASVYDQMAGLVYALACSMADDVGWSRKVAAEAMTEIWRAAPRYERSEGSGRSWIVGTARRHIVSRLRHARTTEVHEPDWPEHQAVLLAWHGGCTLDEIGGRLGLAREAVARLIRDDLLQAAPASKPPAA